MSKVYLNPDMINHLNSTFQAYFNLWLEKQNAIMRSQPQIIQDNQKLIGITTLIASIFTLYVFVKIIFAPTKYSSSYRPVNFSLSAPEAAQNNWKGKRSVSTNILNPEEPNCIQCHCPATGQYLGSFPSKTETDIDEMVSKAKKAQSTWGRSDFSRRLRVLASLHDYILNNQDLIARVACRDSGKTMLDASMGEILVTLEKIQWTIKHGERALQPSRRPGPTNFFMKWYKGAEIRYEPLGVILSLIHI